MTAQSPCSDFGATAVETAFLLTECEALLARALGRALAPHGISWPQALSLLVLVEQQGDVSATRLVERLGLGRTAMTSVVDRLERQGWVERRPLPSDRRVALLILTDAGRAKSVEIRPVIEAAASDYFGSVSEDELTAWQAGVERLRATLRSALPAGMGASAGGASFHDGSAPGNGGSSHNGTTAPVQALRTG